PLLIFGTGNLAVNLGRLIKRSRTRTLVAYVDDSNAMAGRYIDGKRIYRPSKIPNLVVERNVQEIILAVENRNASDRSALLKSLEKYGVRVRLLPDLESIALGNVNLESLRNVEGKDLLGREETTPDPLLLS